MGRPITSAEADYRRSQGKWCWDPDTYRYANRPDRMQNLSPGEAKPRHALPTTYDAELVEVLDYRPQPAAATAEGGSPASLVFSSTDPWSRTTTMLSTVSSEPEQVLIAQVTEEAEPGAQLAELSQSLVPSILAAAHAASAAAPAAAASVAAAAVSANPSQQTLGGAAPPKAPSNPSWQTPVGEDPYMTNIANPSWQTPVGEAAPTIIANPSW